MEYRILASFFGLWFGFQVIYIISKALWNLYLHPLRRIPGPKTWIAFPILRHLESTMGHLDLRMKAFYRTYGEAVRLGPDEVSFITAQAWKDIYGHGHRQLQKFNFTSNMQAPDIITSNDVDHSRFRKALSHGFSAKGARACKKLLYIYSTIFKLISFSIAILLKYSMHSKTGSIVAA
jgi:hypothetical protein